MRGCLVLLLVAAGCSSAVPNDSADASVGVCAPVGTWNLTYTAQSDAGRCFVRGSVDHLIISEADGGYAYELGVADASVTGSFDDAGCRAQVHSHASWTTSGEAQTDDRELDVTFSGDRVSGTMKFQALWECQTSVDSERTFSVSGARAQ